MYNSPIKILYGSTQRGIEDDVFKAILPYGIQVDKDELIRALAYDRGQYDKGFADGKVAAMDALVRCKDCEHNNESRALRCGGVWCDYWGTDPDPDDFCCKGERRSDG